MCSQARRPLSVSAVALSGLFAVLGCGSDQSSPTAPPEQASPVISAAAAAPLSFYQLSSGWDRTCGVTTDNRAYCWGYNAEGYLGDGTTTNRAAPVAVVGGLRFRQITTGAEFTCGVTTDFRAYCWGFGGRGELGTGGTDEHQFRHVEAGFAHACGLSYPDNRVYCCGANTDGQPGIGNRTGPDSCHFGGACSLKPVPIASTLTFNQIAAG